MKWLTTTLCLLAILACTTNAVAGRCSGIDPPSRVFCDDFDRWCNPPPANPEDACAIGSTPDTTGLHEFWPQSEGTCNPNYPIALQQEPMWKPTGWSVIVRQNADIQRVVRHVHDMTTEIQNNARNQPERYGAVNGSGTVLSSTDSSYKDPKFMPDTLKAQFIMHPSTHGAYANFIHYLEIYLDDDRAPTDFTRVNCYPEAQGPYQVLKTTDETVHASFAFGLMAIMDANPCDVQTGRKPTLYRAVVYDGLTWYQLKLDSCPFDLPGPPDDGDFRVAPKWNIFNFYIGTNNIEIRLQNTTSESKFAEGKIPNEYFVAQVPREYTGPFNKIAFGAAKGLDLTTPTCELVGFPGAMTCVGGSNSGNFCFGDVENCPASTAEECVESLSGNNSHQEEIVLYDGVFRLSGTQGACCRVDTGTCEDDVVEPDCTAPDIWYSGQYCADVLCCVDPFADADHDGDVDQVDFGLWQACYSGDGNAHPDTKECKCFNRDGGDPGDIDGADFFAFSACWSGPTVPAEASCDD